jgi:nitrite reductase/ring-hydroxylating ferredoxin subunit
MSSPAQTPESLALSDALERRGLRCAGRYRRTIAAGIERVWENVLDWEHLPWLHESAFAAVELLEESSSGWRARVVSRGSKRERSQVLEVRIERERRRYVSATLDGPGAGTEIWTHLDPSGADATGIDVAFWLPERDPARAALLGTSLVRVYERLWDEDEAMMQRRTRELAARAPVQSGPRERALGPLAALRARLPLQVELAGRAFRVVEVNGVLVAHATRCPHRLGPLEDAPVDGDCGVRCPWHGYRFDVRSGASLDGKRLRLPIARLDVAPDGAEVVLRLA